MQGRKQKKNRIVLTLLAACMLLCGCGEVVPETEEVVETMPTLGLTPSFNYSVEKQMPSVMVDPMGYLPASNRRPTYMAKYYRTPLRWWKLKAKT